MISKTTTKNLLGLAGWLAVTFMASAVGAIASMQAQPFYQQLVQPSWAPPSSIFGPVWTLLYALMATAAWLIWRKKGLNGYNGVLWFYLAHLVVNASWSWLFFALQKGNWALLNIAILWVMIVILIAVFWRIKPLASVLLWPYLVWVSFAMALNYTLWQANPGILG